MSQKTGVLPGFAAAHFPFPSAIFFPAPFFRASLKRSLSLGAAGSRLAVKTATEAVACVGSKRAGYRQASQDAVKIFPPIPSAPLAPSPVNGHISSTIGFLLFRFFTIDSLRGRGLYRGLLRHGRGFHTKKNPRRRNGDGGFLVSYSHIFGHAEPLSDNTPCSIT